MGPIRACGDTKTTPKHKKSIIVSNCIIHTVWSKSLKKIEILNFHHLQIENAKSITKPLDQAAFEDKESLTVVVARNPYDYFDSLLYDYLVNEKSILFTQDIIDHMKEQDGRSFFQWFDGLNFIPFQNPQTFHLDIRKRVPQALESLESFDYVVPYEALETFLEKVAPDIRIDKKGEERLLFSLSSLRGEELTEKYVGKDSELYRRALELWEFTEENGYRTLPSLLGGKRISQRKEEEKQEEEKSKKMQLYRGVAGKITDRSIAGWVFHKEEPEKVTVGIYKNGDFLCMAKADRMREDLKRQHIHPTGECGFEVRFDEETFKKGDRIEVKILPDKIPLPLRGNIEAFLGA